VRIVLEWLLPGLTHCVLLLIIPENLIISLCLLHPLFIIVTPLLEKLDLLRVKEQRLASGVLAEIYIFLKKTVRRGALRKRAFTALVWSRTIPIIFVYSFYWWALGSIFNYCIILLWLNSKAFKPLGAAKRAIDLLSFLFLHELLVSLREDLDEILFGDPFLDHLVDNSILDTIHPFLF
jgi:hypothetical protein